MRAEQESDFLEFVAARTDRLRRFGYLCCGDWHRAEDAVQVTLVKLYAAWTRACKTSVDAYARRILVNTLIDEHRRGWFRRERVSGRLPDQPIADQGDASAQKLTVMAALSRLPKRQRAVVVLRYWEDLPIEQTAQIMRCSIGTVKSQAARGLQTLRGLLTEPTHERVEKVTSW